MAASIGRAFKIKKGATVLAGVRSKTVSINNTAVDISDDADDGFPVFLAEPGEKSLNISIEGVAKDEVLSTLAYAGTPLLTDITLEYPNGDVVDGDFYMESIEISAPYKEATTFTATLKSSGEYTLTVAP